MDINSQAALDTAAIHLKDAKGGFLYDDGKPVRIVIYGPGSKAFAEIEAKQSARALKRMQDNDNKIAIASPEQRLAEESEDLAALTVSFDNLTYSPAGEAQGRALFQALYADPKLGFIREQVGKSVKDWSLFAPGSPTN